MKILIYGYGKMTAAMVEGWLRTGMDAGDIAAYNPRPKDTATGVSLTT
ncbi:MAG: hypothetical protein R3235_01820 [Altererythrobacter ishigakiensis]|nr:hypothetical protein [Altererythrobacter ishigakiensis]